ncbi:MAG: hypothetical protein ACOYM3_23805 [Terrimicrobiaceae bacterium]
MKKKSNQQKTSPDNEASEFGDQELDIPLDTPDELIREAFKLFCVPTNSKKKGAEEALIRKRQEFMGKLARISSLNDDFGGSSQSEQLLCLLEEALFKSSYWEVLTELNKQETVQLFQPFSIFPPLAAFVSSQRERIREYLDTKKAKELQLHDGRKLKRIAKSGKSKRATPDDMVVELLIFCYRRIKDQTLNSPVLESIKEVNISLRKKWNASRREEDKREKKSQKNNRRAGEGHKLPYLELWLLRYWTDPRLPLCALNLEDTLKAAVLSPELPEIWPESDEKPYKTTEEAIRQVAVRVGLDKFPEPLAGNIRKRTHGWPTFDFDINPDMFQEDQRPAIRALYPPAGDAQPQA